MIILFFYVCRYSKLAIDFIYYHNPSNNKATGSACDEDGSFCDIFVEVCISPVRSRFFTNVDLYLMYVLSLVVLIILLISLNGLGMTPLH